MSHTHITMSAAAVLEKAKQEYLRDGYIDSVTAFDLTLEGFDPDTVIEEIRVKKERAVSFRSSH